MGCLSVSGLEELLRGQDCIVLMCAGKIVCGCSKEFGDLASLAEHLAKAHTRRPKREAGEEESEVQGLQEHFRRNFTFPPENENAVTVTLPEDITCVCLGEHDIGAFAADIKCHICHKLCGDLDSLNKHIASVHRVFHRLVGHNIIFEKPDASHVKPAFYCPMIKCKYHVAESFQRKYFKTFKLLKQHYIKVHASKEFNCSKCEQKFASKTYLDIHSKNCGVEIGCQDCSSKFSSIESAQTHCRRKGHSMIPSQMPAKSPKARDPGRDKLTILQSYPGPGRVPIAPRPSTMHINAAIALSELSATQLYTPRADIGVQTDVDIWRHRKSVTPASCEPGLMSPGLSVTTETQTRSRKRALRPDKVSSQVQTLGEFSVRAKRAKMEDEGMVSTTETQCSPAKRMKTDLCSVTTMTSLSDVLELSYVPEVSGVTQDTDYLWPLRCHTNGTQTSPRMARLPRRISEDDEADELNLPSLEPVEGSINITKTKLGETRQFSTETQTDLDIFLDNYDDVEKLLTTEMETQTHEGDENLLLLANNYTQTGTEDFLSALMIGSGGEGERRQHELELGTNTNPFKLDYVCSAETQTRLTGFQDQNLLLQIGNNQEKEKTSGHSTLLSKDMSVYEMVTDTVIPREWDAYIGNKKKLVEAAQANSDAKGTLVGSWTIVTGDAAFKAFHLYKYEGWTDIDESRMALKKDQEYQQIYKATLPAINEQFNELTKAFSFWPSPDKRIGGNIYDIRSYSLRPGSMYDWSNYWAKGIQFRSNVRPDIPYAGLFTQLGELHTIYHIWCYESMADRKGCREATWHYPEWNDVVANTVPLVKTMKTRILEPLEFSPTQ